MSRLTTSGWTKARKSTANGNCVEVMLVDGGVAVRDSKNPDGATLRFTAAEWNAFMSGANNGEFDLPRQAS